jgi:glycosyltransferase involved in cell wall biosynthesis
LVVLSDGAFVLPADLMELCLAKGWPFVTIAQANTETWWPNDQLADRYRRALQLALRCYFVSTGNLRLAEKQLGHKFNNAEVVWNPFNVRVDARPGWPSLGTDDQLRLASVGRLYPPAKGQDILLEALAGGSWAARSWRLTLYGDGSARNGLERLAEHLGLSHRVFFAGHTPDVEQIWAENHVLVMPSRVEGLPLTMVEAALCGRPVVATNIAGHSEIIDDGVTGFLADAPTARSFAGALERLWERRTDLEEIGDLAARRIREKIPADPVQVFAEKLTTLAGLTRSPTLRGRP